MYFIGVNIVELEPQHFSPLFKRLKRIAGRNKMHFIASQHQKKFLQIHESGIENTNELSLENSAPVHYTQHPTAESSILPYTVTFLSDIFLQSNQPYFLEIDNVELPPTGLLKKFDRAVAYLQNTDPDWGILSGIYHKSFNSFATSENSNSHVLKGCSVYKREIIELEKFKKNPISAIILAAEKERRKYFNLYAGHEVKTQNNNLVSTRPQIVRDSQVSIFD